MYSNKKSSLGFAGEKSSLEFSIGGNTVDGNRALSDVAAGRVTPEVEAIAASTAASGSEKAAADSIRAVLAFTKGFSKGAK